MCVYVCVGWGEVSGGVEAPESLVKISDILSILVQVAITAAFQLSSSHLIYPLTMRVVGAPQVILQPVSSIFH